MKGFIEDIESLATANNEFRRVLYRQQLPTGAHDP
jgi:hypothetical protein